MKTIECTPYKYTIHKQVQIKYNNRKLATLHRKQQKALHQIIEVKP